MEQLPNEVLTSILEFLDIANRVQLAGCNTTLQHRVFRDCPKVWETIDFSTPEHYPCSISVRIPNNITDQGLANLLTRVNAVEVTKRLNICYCENIRGSGLLPLRGSRTLEWVLLVMTGESANEDPAPFLSILRTCIPYKLAFVGFRTNSDATDEFYRHLRQAKLLQAREALCSSCHEPVVDPSQQQVQQRLGPPLHTCQKCSGTFCRRGSCPVDVRECFYCSTTRCGPCGGVLRCDFCGKSFCEDLCNEMNKCMECNLSCCNECIDNIGDRLRVCSVCVFEWICTSCLNKPDECSDSCAVCTNCWKDQCMVCGDHFCECNYGSRCYGCRGMVCKKDDCKQSVQICAARPCSLCRNCREMEKCGGCEKSFCKCHSRLVECKKCNMRHCRACRWVRRCGYCGTACYEDCVCSESRPSKKAKTAM